MNPIEQYQYYLQKAYNFFFGNVEDIDKPMRWYNYLNASLKFLCPLIGVAFLIFHKYLYAGICFFATLLDILNYVSLKRRYEAYKEYKKILDGK